MSDLEIVSEQPDINPTPWSDEDKKFLEEMINSKRKPKHGGAWHQWTYNHTLEIHIPLAAFPWWMRIPLRWSMNNMVCISMKIFPNGICQVKRIEPCCLGQKYYVDREVERDE